MPNVHELERAWLRYKIKHLLPRVIGASLAIFVAAVALFYWYGISDGENLTSAKPDTQRPSSSKVIAETPRQDAAATPSVLLTQPAAATIQPQAQQTSPAPAGIPSSSHSDKRVAVLKPSMGFMHDIKNNSASYHPEQKIKTTPQQLHETTQQKATKQISPSKTTGIPEKKTVAAVPLRVESVPEEKTVVSVPDKPAINIVAKQDEEDLKDVIRRFQKNKNPALSLFVAKRYYDTKRYQKAYNYALITNDIDSGIEESWLIFAKSLVKLDQKEMAIKALASYVKVSDSARAKILLDEITKGGFR